jgi:hypothetical protein
MYLQSLSPAPFIARLIEFWQREPNPFLVLTLQNVHRPPSRAEEVIKTPAFLQPRPADRQKPIFYNLGANPTGPRNPKQADGLSNPSLGFS